MDEAVSMHLTSLHVIANFQTEPDPLSYGPQPFYKAILVNPPFLEGLFSENKI